MEKGSSFAAGRQSGGGTYEAWVRFAHGDKAVIFPQDGTPFTGFMIGRFVVEESFSPKQFTKNDTLTIKGEMPSLSRTFFYLLRFKQVYRPTGNAPAGGRGRGRGANVQSSSSSSSGAIDCDVAYELLPKAGFRDAKRIPWTYQTLGWSLINECNGFSTSEVKQILAAVFPAATAGRAKADSGKQLGVLAAAFSPDPEAAGVSAAMPSAVYDAVGGDGSCGESLLQTLPCFETLQAGSDYYRLQRIILVKRGWPTKLAEIRKIETEALGKLVRHLMTAPHELCYVKHSKEYGLGEMTFGGLNEVLAEMGDGRPASCGNLQMAAACFYNYLRNERVRLGHTSFLRSVALDRFGELHTRDIYAPIVTAALMWLVREEHLVFVDAAGQAVLRENWFDAGRVTDVQFVVDYRLKQRIVGHLRRIHANYVASQGFFVMRPGDECVGAVPGSALNAKQREFVMHVFNNWLTVLQGGPGSGKTFAGIPHLLTFFAWPEVLTHVGRQAVAICDLLGGSNENARTIHSEHARCSSVFTRAYNQNKDILVLDEVYNSDDWTFEKALAAAPEANRLVMIGDPNQIRPIPGEQGAGTPALDIARAFGEHVIFLDENMRQRADARAIHSVVSSVLRRRTEDIQWGSNLDRDPVVLLSPSPLPGGETMRSLVSLLVARLRRDCGGGGASEHQWQLITFYNGDKGPTAADDNGGGSGGGGRPQGDGVKQLNEMVEEHLEKTHYFRNRTKYRINARLVLYDGFKLIFSAKMAPNRAKLGPLLGSKKKAPSAPRGRRAASGGQKRLRAAAAGEAPVGAASSEGGGDSNSNFVFQEVLNGQIEVVKEVKQLKLRGIRAVCWDVLCYPRSGTRPGTRFLINAEMHVDASKIYAAWAVTSNKSMGGECANVGVFVPPEATNSSWPDISNMYVALSRPTQFLGVIGTRGSIRAVVSRNPPPINSGLFTYCRSADSAVPEAPFGTENDTPPDKGDDPPPPPSPLRLDSDAPLLDWKRKSPVGTVTLAAQCVIDRICDGDPEALFDQTTRKAFSAPRSICPVGFDAFYRSVVTKRAKCTTAEIEAHDKAFMARVKDRLYHNGPRPIRETDPGQPADPRLVDVPPPVDLVVDDEEIAPAGTDEEDDEIIEEDDEDARPRAVKTGRFEYDEDDLIPEEEEEDQTPVQQVDDDE